MAVGPRYDLALSFSLHRSAIDVFAFVSVIAASGLDVFFVRD